MSWYYAVENERLGPVADGAFDALIRAGTIRPDTLVWRQGMANWAAFSEAGYQPAAAGAPPPFGTVPGGAGTASDPGVEMGVCSESGRTLPRSELVEIEGRLVSAEYKNVVLQRIREGVSATGSGEDAEQLGERIAQRDWHISASDCVSRGWALVKSRFWLTVGATFVIYLLAMAASLVPIIGPLIVQGPLFAGLYWLLLKIKRGQPAGLEDAFQGFSRGWGALIAVTLVLFLIMFACILPGMVLIGLSTVPARLGEAGETMPMLSIAGGVACLIGACVATYFTVAWIFAMPLIVDKRFEFWPAMQLSKRVVSMHWWKIFWLLIFIGVVIMALLLVGILAISLVVAFASSMAGEPSVMIGLAVLFGVALAFGFFTVLPLAFSALMVAYDDIFAPSSLRV